MFSVVEDHEQVAQAEQVFAAKMLALTSQETNVTVGFSGQSFPLVVSWSDQLGIWMSFQQKDNGYRNTFGTERPVSGRHTQIACEINFPLAGLNRKMSGVVGTSGRTANLIAHRGRIGGRNGVDKTLFIDRFAGAWEDFADGDKVSRIALVGRLDAPQFPWQVANFVRQVDQIKRQVTNRPASDALWQANLVLPNYAAPESNRGESELLAQCNRGWIGTSLVTALAKYGLVAVAGGSGELVTRRSDLTLVFEIRTDTNMTSILAGLGRLFLAQHAGRQEQLVLVTPPGLPISVAERLTEVGVQTVHYNLGPNAVDFIDLDQLLQVNR